MLAGVIDPKEKAAQWEMGKSVMYLLRCSTGEFLNTSLPNLKSKWKIYQSWPEKGVMTQSSLG